MDNTDSVSRDMASLFYFASTLSKYSEEEKSALFHSIPMTEEIFEKCLETSFSVCDIENIRYLEKTYPDLAEKSPFLNDLKKEFHKTIL